MITPREVAPFITTANVGFIRLEGIPSFGSSVTCHIGCHSSAPAIHRTALAPKRRMCSCSVSWDWPKTTLEQCIDSRSGCVYDCLALFWEQSGAMIHLLQRPRGK